MLHILWLLLKFILIILGILSGLLLLTVLLVLFCPVRYKVSAVKAEGDWKQTEGECTVSWLFHGASLKAGWRNRQMEISFHLFGIPVDKLLKKRREKKANTKKHPKKSGTGCEPENAESNINAESVKNNNESIKNNNESIKNDHTSIDQYKQLSGQKNLDAGEMQTQETASADISEQRQFLIKKIYDRIRGIFRKIKIKLQNIHGTLQKIKNNLSWWKEFIGHPRVIAARNLVWKHAKFLLKHVCPTKIEGQVTFSFEDPALTGTALAILGMTIPFHKNRVQISPRFDGENYLYGNMQAKGRIYGFVVARAALIIYFDKNIKYVVKRWKTRRV